MALSLLQEQQSARGISVRPLATMKHEDDRSMSPPMNQHPNIFPGLHPATASAMGMLAPNFFSGNPAATAALLAAGGLPMSLQASLAGGLFHHHQLFRGWGPSSCSSPPKSPISPVYGIKERKYTNNNNHIVSTTSDMKKSSKRKPFAKKEINTVSLKKELLSPPSTDVSMNHEMMSPGMISPPNSGSSPNSTGSIDVPTTIVSASTTKDSSRDKVFTCKICNRSFGYKHVLQNHERTHTGEKPFECPECHKRFTRDHHLKTHMRLHTGEKPYSCSHCDRQFVQVANLRRHLRVHTGERPYTCDICNARFSDSNQLKAHSIAHTGEKPFACNRCGSRYRRKHLLDNHKCDNNSSISATSPLTPMMSPNMYMSDVKSEFSEDSLDLSKISSISKSTPFNQTMRYTDDSHGDIVERRNRKATEVRHVVRIPQQIMHLPSMLPEQTEPEDLSMHSPRSPITSPVSMEELEELDDAAALYMKQRMQKLQHGMES